MNRFRVPVIKYLIDVAQDNVSEEIKDFIADRDSIYAKGMASEGYSGGYRQALMDVKLLFCGALPDTRNYWRLPADNQGKSE